MNQDIRWIQRFDSFKRGFKQLNDAVNLSKERDLSLLEKQGLIQAFEFTHELGWNMLKDYLEYQGNQEVRGSRDAIREALKVGLIHDGEVWMETIKARNLTSHTYNEEMVQDAYTSICKNYLKVFFDLSEVFEKLKAKELGL
jgi:nucleotidyltransferase substrate binding protein (TIGR01987 family)